MKILALYAQRSLSIMRRVQAPFSVLATRNHSFAFMQITAFDPGLAAGYEVTVLPNWILTDEENKRLAEVAVHSTFSYDLADPTLLQMPSVRYTMKLCKLVTVPNEFLRKEVEIAVRGVKCVVLPSVIDIPYLLIANSYPKPDGKIIGCIGPYDWSLIKAPLAQIREEFPQVLFMGDRGAYEVLKESMCEPLDLTPQTYPGFLRMVQMGLAPLAQDHGQDTIWEHEYGLLCRPVLTLHAKATPEQWKQGILALINGHTFRSKLGLKAHERAKHYSATRLADQYLKVYRNSLPYLSPFR